MSCANSQFHMRKKCSKCAKFGGLGIDWYVYKRGGTTDERTPVPWNMQNLRKYNISFGHGHDIMANPVISLIISLEVVVGIKTNLLNRLSVVKLGHTLGVLIRCIINVFVSNS